MDPMMFFMYLIQSLQSGGLGNSSNNNGPFNSDTNAGWGANAYIDSVFNNTGSFSYTRETDEGSVFGDDLSADSALAFAEMGLRTVDGEHGNGNGSVSIYEFDDSCGMELGRIISSDDEVISQTDLAAYYMLTDEMDGSLDGNISQNGTYMMNMLATISPELLETMLEAKREQITEVSDDFEMPDAPQVDGDEGPYSEDDIIGRGANAAAESANLTDTERLHTDVRFLQENEDGTLNMESGLAFSQELIDIHGQNAFDVPDLNGDGEITADELLASLITQDEDGDGVMEYEERLASTELKESSGYTDSVKEIYDDKGLEGLLENFEMPEVVNEDYSTGSSSSSGGTGNAIIDALLKFFEEMFGISL